MIKLEKIIAYGLYLLVFLLPVQTRWIIRAGEINGGYTEYGTISLYGIDILLLLLLGLFAIYRRRRQKVTSAKLQVPGIWRVIAGLDLFVFISIFFAPDRSLAAYHYGVFLLGVGLFWLVTSADYNKLKLVYAFLGGALAQAGLGIWQFLTQSSFASKWLGIAIHDPGILGTSVVETVGPGGIGERWLRAYGGLDHPNVLGGLLAVGLLAVVILAAGRRNDNNQESRGRRVVAGGIFPLFVFFVLVAALFFTFSRGAWAGLVAGMGVILFSAVIKKDFLAQRRILEFILAGGVLAFVLASAYGGLARTRLSADTRLEVKSNTERLASYNEAWQVIRSNWLFGAGVGNYAAAVHDRVNAAEQSWYYQPTHNTFLLIWAETGIFGLVFFLALLILNSYFLIQNRGQRTNSDFFKLGLVAALIVMFCVDHWWWSLHFGVIMFWLVMGFMYAHERQLGNT